MRPVPTTNFRWNDGGFSPARCISSDNALLFISNLLLHRAMALAGFDNTIEGAEGIVYDLPPAEYYHPETVQPIDQVHVKAKAAASSTGRMNATVVTDANRVKFSGLTRAYPTSAFIRRYG